MKACATILFLLPITVAFSHGARLQPTIADCLDRAMVKASEGNWAEARARAEALLHARPVTYSVDRSSPAVVRALDTWGGRLGIQFVPADPQTSDLRIVLRTRLTLAGRQVMGLANVRRRFHQWDHDSFSFQTSATLEVATLDPFGAPVSDDVLTNIVLHEVGHFLGLEDAFGRNTVMSPLDLRRPVLEPSSAEVDCLLDLQARAQQVMDLAALSAR